MSIHDLLEFLDNSPSPWHAVENAQELLLNRGFKLLREEDAWSLKPGGRYFVTRNGSSLCAFVVPTASPTSTCLLASHTDSPGFKLKPRPDFRKENMAMLGLEIYGSPLITSWLNRDLGIAGRITYLDHKNKLHQSLVKLVEQPVTIPQLAIHLDRKVNEDGLLLNKQEQLAALIGLVEESADISLASMLKEIFPVKELLATDLFLFPLEPAALIGCRQEMIASYRIDSLISVYAILQAIVETKKVKSDVIKFISLCDNEEIGSETAHGAGSPFAREVLERIYLALDLPREAFLQSLRKSLCVSIDLAHALHPNYGDRHEPRHPVLMQKGIAVKFSSQQRYATDAFSAGKILALCHELKIPVQSFVSKGDIPAGTTIGPIYAHTLGMPTVDIGCPQLSMHSAREIASCKDYLAMCHLLKNLLN